MRIDAHIHGIHAERNNKGILIPPLVCIWDTKNDPRKMIEENHRNGIERVVVLDPPYITFQLADAFGDFVVPIPKINMDFTTIAEIHALFERGAKGIKFIAPAYPYSDERYFPLYKAVLEHDAPAVFHTGYLINHMYEPGCINGRQTYTDITNMRPAALDRVARAFPDLKIIMAHFGNPWWDEAWGVVRQHPGIYTDLSGGTAVRKSMDFWKDMFAPDGQLDLACVEKLCYASDGGAFTPGKCSSERLMEFHDRLYEALKLPAELIEKINRGNILKLLNES